MENRHIDYETYLARRIARLEMTSNDLSESRHHKRTANWMLKAYKDALASLGLKNPNRSNALLFEKLRLLCLLCDCSGSEENEKYVHLEEVKDE